MQTIQVRDGAIVLVLTKEEAKSLQLRLSLKTGIIESKAVKRVRVKLADAMGEV